MLPHVVDFSERASLFESRKMTIVPKEALALPSVMKIYDPSMAFSFDKGRNQFPVRSFHSRMKPHPSFIHVPRNDRLNLNLTRRRRRFHYAT